MNFNALQALLCPNTCTLVSLLVQWYGYRRASTVIKTSALKRANLELTHTTFCLPWSSFTHHQLPTRLICMWSGMIQAQHKAWYCSSTGDGAILCFLDADGRQHVPLAIGMDNQVPWFSCVHKAQLIFHIQWERLVWGEVSSRAFFPNIMSEVGINLNMHQGDYWSQRDMHPQGTNMVGKLEEQRTLNAIMGTTNIVQTLALPSESTELIKD